MDCHLIKDLFFLFAASPNDGCKKTKTIIFVPTLITEHKTRTRIGCHRAEGKKDKSTKKIEDKKAYLGKYLRNLKRIQYLLTKIK